MGKLENFLSGSKILEEVVSPINGRLTVIRDLAWGVHIKAGGLTQSGGVAEKVWYASLKEVEKAKTKVNKCLILGLGGGGAVRVVRKYWPKTAITGVEIDPIMIDLGGKYMGLKEGEVEVVIEDAMKYVKRQTKKKERYDLILVDLYIGDTIPEKFASPAFYTLIRKLLRRGGAVVINRLYYSEKRKLADITHQELKEIFSEVVAVYPEANIMFVCSDSDKMKVC
ncbi:fused MFS/spermidine synthase [Patescibacteria group bacterium]|nr:fused MFS/spermidine synthase [Patescibacteria group bacterium]MBU0776890.1 fused MFS/spermidine synthase [Patescibacteria group bacterium]MBU0846231.1 fused MFS/spermidine synthase [Patescibacteria group bacterium]MBU0922578.1 fused MFS/spermidine synthase [Patescibacteria group bacterium]MBU1066629.1 fused MFS/spermidine synthase [Patescibacteria group bacterium]